MNELNRQKHDEERDKLHELTDRLRNFSIFYDSWWVNKCLKYDGEQLAHHYDLFFSRFVTYNNLYNSIVSVRNYLGPKRIKTLGDERKAIDCMAAHFSTAELNMLFEKPNFIQLRSNLIKMIDEQFVITHKDGKQSPKADSGIQVKLMHTDKRKIIYGLLEVLYNVRCNMFHGSKGYHDSQIGLLKVLNEFLFEIVTILYRSYRLLIEAEIKKAGDAMDKITAEINQSKMNFNEA